MISLSDDEIFAINTTIDNGKQFGFGNLISWLLTAWEKELIASGLDADTARDHVTGWGEPYSQEFLSFVEQFQIEEEK